MVFKTRLPIRNLKQSVSAGIGVLALGAALIGSGSGAIAQTATDFVVGEAVVVNSDDLQFRSDATLSADVLDVLGDGTEATITDGPVTADDYTWYAVDVAGETGWVAADFLQAAVAEQLALIPAMSPLARCSL